MPTEEQLKLIEQAPEDASRVKVVDSQGKGRWRFLPGVSGSANHALLDTDKINIGSDGKAIFMSGTPGRRKRSTKRTPKSELQKVIVTDKKQHVSRDGLLKAVREDPESVDVLHETIKAIALECASLEFERIEADRKGENSAMISNRRIAALTKIGDTWLKRMDQVMAKGFDLESTAFQEVFNLIMETFRGAMKDAGVKTEIIKLVFTKFSHRIEDESWTTEAKLRMKQQ